MLVCGLNLNLPLINTLLIYCYEIVWKTYFDPHITIPGVKIHVNIVNM